MAMRTKAGGRRAPRVGAAKRVSPLPPVIPAKIIRPALANVYSRARLFRVLDGACRRSVVWISAPAGAGKTTLVTSYAKARTRPTLWYQMDDGDADVASFFYYMALAAKQAAPRYRTPLPLLTPEYAAGLSAFTRNYFRELYARLKRPALLVLDNYHEIPADAVVHEVMRHAFEEIPPGINIVIVSRTDPPAEFAHLQAGERIAVIRWDDMRLTEQESIGIAALREKRGQLSRAALRQLHEETGGWVAGLVLLMEQSGHRAATMRPPAAANQTVFDYFADQIFRRADPLTQDFLLKTAYLPKISVAAASGLTGVESAERILGNLTRRNYFTFHRAGGGEQYEYHPLFREFLLSRARDTYSEQALKEIQYRAAGLLAADGDVPGAVALMIEAQAWDDLTRIIVECAQSMLAEGRGAVLENWLRTIPSDFLQTAPWLLFWFGNCRLAFDPVEARRYFEVAYARFDKAPDVTGLFLAWSSIAESFLYEWGDFSPADRWIDVLGELLVRYPGALSPQIEARVAGGMFNLLVWRQPQHPDLSSWAERVKKIVLESRDLPLQMGLGIHLVPYYLWIGEFASASIVVDVLRKASSSGVNAPLTQMTWWVMCAMHAWFTGQHGTCAQAVARGTDLAQESGVHLLDLYLTAQAVYSGVSHEDPVMVTESMVRMDQLPVTRLVDKALYHYQASTVAWYQNDLPRAVEHGRMAVDLTERTGAPLPQALCLIELGSMLFEVGRHEEAMACLAKGKHVGRGMCLIEYVCLLHEARIALDRNMYSDAISVLRQAMTLGAAQGYVNIPRWRSTTMARLCGVALDHDIESDYVRSLIRKRRLQIPVAMADATRWPYDTRINTLGTFSLVVANKPWRSQGKLQRKPLELLKLLVVSGERGLPVEQVVEMLWPDVGGEKAYSAHTSAIYRLRKLLENENAVLTHDGRVALNREECCVDAWVFERLLDQAARSQVTDPAETARLLRRALDIYRGTFSNDEEGAVWATTYQERLHNKFIQATLTLGHACENRQEFEEALSCYYRGLELDDLAEPFYQKILSCCHALGRTAEGFSVFARCERRLQEALGVRPSPQTLRLRDSLDQL